MTVSVLIDDSLNAEREALLFEDPRALISADAPADVAAALTAMEAALADGAHLAGFFSYELGYVFEPNLLPLLPPERKLPLLWFGVFDAPLPLSEDDVRKNLSARSSAYQLGDLAYSMEREIYRQRFDRVKSYIAAGDAYQLNLTFKAKFDFTGEPAALYADLRGKQPVAYGALIETPEFSILSVSPELFVSQSGRSITTRPMKGTAARGDTPEDDQKVRDWLASDLKSRAENLMIVDLMRNDFGRVGEIGSVKVDDLFGVETYPTLHQMTSGIRARLRDDVGLPELIGSIFPPGSVTGAPKLRAVEILAELEDEARGVYTGAVGMFSPSGEARFNVAIRTLTLDSRGAGEIGLGAGIVQDSRADDEYDECLLKLQFLRDAAQPFQLIETMRHDPGGGYYLLERHLERLARSADYFGFRFDRNEIEAALSDESPHFGGSFQRVRLLVGHDGVPQISAVAIEAPTDSARMSYVFSDQTIDTSDRFLYHKTTRRELYDGEHTRLSAMLGCDEVLFLNERGELAEGSRTNIFVQIGGRLLTPALGCGLLPGTMRSELIEAGQAHEAILLPSDLEEAEQVFLGNSVRGLVSAYALLAPQARAAGGG